MQHAIKAITVHIADLKDISVGIADTWENILRLYNFLWL